LGEGTTYRNDLSYRVLVDVTCTHRPVDQHRGEEMRGAEERVELCCCP